MSSVIYDSMMNVIEIDHRVSHRHQTSMKPLVTVLNHPPNVTEFKRLWEYMEQGFDFITKHVPLSVTCSYMFNLIITSTIHKHFLCETAGQTGAVLQINIDLIVSL